MCNGKKMKDNKLSSYFLQVVAEIHESFMIWKHDTHAHIYIYVQVS